MEPWYSAANRAFSVFQVASALGGDYQARKNCELSRCPSPDCRGGKRYKNDRRLVVNITADQSGRAGRRWYCFACQTGGGTFDFTSLHLTGRKFRDLDPAGKDEVREWWEAFEGTDLGLTHTKQYNPIEGLSEAAIDLKQLAEEDALALWKSAERLDESHYSEPGYWLEEARNLSAEEIAHQNLSRELVDDGKLPEFARLAFDKGHRLVVPLWDHKGAMRGFRFRWYPKPDEHGRFDPKAKRELKCLVPKGYTTRGLLMLNQAARQMVNSGQGLSGNIFLTEGEMDYLDLATRAGNQTAAVIGYTVGAWQEHGSPWPDTVNDGSRVIIVWDNDEAGIRMRDKIQASFRDREGVDVVALTAEQIDSLTGREGAPNVH